MCVCVGGGGGGRHPLSVVCGSFLFVRRYSDLLLSHYLIPISALLRVSSLILLDWIIGLYNILHRRVAKENCLMIILR